MKRYRLIFKGALVLVAWFGLGLNQIFAQGTAISPVDIHYPFLPYQSPVTVSILNGAGSDITAEWDPQPGTKVYIRVNNSSGASVTLEGATTDPIKDGVLMTSAYPGVCTNYDGLNPSAPDFSLKTSLSPPELTVNDFGGMAVIRVTATNGATYFFILPQDSDFDGIPDWYEKKYCGSGATCLYPYDDIDTGPDSASPTRDGIANIDEYRGFRVGGVYKRGNPLVKDVLVNLVEVPQCTDTAYEKDGSNNLIQLSTFYGTNFSLLFSVMDKLMPGIVVHHIKSDEWIDSFDKYTVVGEVTLKAGAEPKYDRQINKNAIFRAAENEGIVKGIRLVECLDLSTSSPLGLTRSKQPPDISLDKDDGTAIIFPQRIWYSFKRKFAGGAGRLVKLYDFKNSAWSQVIQYLQPPPSSSSLPNINFLNTDSVMGVLRDAAFPFYAAHESTGHNLDLTPTVEGTTQQPAGYHHVEGTGTVIDKEIVQVIDKKTAANGGFNKFYIPSLFSPYDKRTMRFLQSQQVVLP